MQFEIIDPEDFKSRALQWGSAFDVCCVLDSNNFSDTYSKFDGLIAAGVKDELIAPVGSAFSQLAAFRATHKGWLTGFLSYDLKNEIENLTSANQDRLHFPALYFFEPLHLIIIKGKYVEVISANPTGLFQDLQKQPKGNSIEQTSVNVKSRITREEYLAAFEGIKAHIKRGDIYVTNFCQEFFAENATVDPLSVFQRLNEISPNPFAAFFKLYDRHILSASPERFFAKRGEQLISQPIKGTAGRHKDAVLDHAAKFRLKTDPKELQENVMIVDLVRNDLTRSARPGTVTTPDLFAVYSFEQVHQMISTVTCQLCPNVSGVESIRNTFPMGSMTGAPKISAMELMDQFESSQRGVYSGALGYFSPDGDFDFNVIIRTILYDAKNKYLSFHAGSAITSDADAEKEYEECLLKISAIMSVIDPA
jgi:para-aminobenzoate synthetase component 1